MDLLHTRLAYHRGELSKHDYIAKMHTKHRLLHDYAALLPGTLVSHIEITGDGVVMTARDTGVRIKCDPHDQRIAPVEVLNFGAYEADDYDMLRRLTQGGGTLLDIGANFGWYALSLTAQNPNLKVHAFEPVPKTFAYLQTNIKLNKNRRIEAHNAGLSNAPGSQNLFFWAEGSGAASLKNTHERADAEKVSCKIWTLDQFSREHGLQVDYIKCDVEGAELLVLQGGMKTIRQHQPIIFAEMLRKWSAKFSYHPNEIIDLLASAGYACYASEYDVLRPVERIDEDTVTTNFFFLHSERHSDMIEQAAQEAEV